MSAVAVLFLVLSILVIWGGLVASVIFLVRSPEVGDYPGGGEETDREPPVEIRDT